MRRTFISFTLIMIFIVSIVGADLWIITKFCDGMTERLDAISMSEEIEEQRRLAEEMDRFYESYQFWLHRTVSTGKLEDIEMLLHKLNAYLKEADENEIEATAAEIRSRVNLLYSTWLYHWYHPFDFRIE